MKAVLVVLLAGASLAMGGSCAKTPESLIPLDYSGWSPTVNTALVYEIPGHTMDIRRIYINEIGERLEITEVNGRVSHEYPQGTILIKENYSVQDSSRPAMLTAMIKSPKDPRARGGWIWVAKDVASGEERLFSDEFCFTCHQNANEAHPYGDGNPDEEFRDFVFYPWNPAGGE